MKLYGQACNLALARERNINDLLFDLYYIIILYNGNMDTNGCQYKTYKEAENDRYLKKK